jgi:hypothetical protein
VKRKIKTVEKETENRTVSSQAALDLLQLKLHPFALHT